MGHATFEWVYVGVVIALLIYVGAASWDVERLLDHPPPVRPYEPGTWGPLEADTLAEPLGGWYEPLAIT